MGVLDPPPLLKPQANKLYPQIPFGNIATRMLTGRIGTTVTNSSTSTYQLTLALAQDFDAVRLIFANPYKQASFGINLVGATVVGSTSDLNNSSGTWATATGFPLAMAPLGGTVDFALTFSDWINVQSIPRTDGGTFPLLIVRAVVRATSTAIPSYGDGVDTFTNWATKPDGRIWVARSQTGDFVTTPSSFTSTTNLNTCPIVGVQYSARGKVVTVMSVGDSITEGRGTYFGDGFVLPAISALSNTSNIAIEYCNCGWSGQAPIDFNRRARYLMDSEINPDIMILPSGSPNVAVPLTAAIIASSAGLRAGVMAEASRRKINVVLWTMLPVTYSVHAWGTSDTLRIADNLVITSQLGSRPHCFVADLSTLFSSTVDGNGQMQIVPAYTTDLIHPNDTGNAALAVSIQAQIKLILGL